MRLEFDSSVPRADQLMRMSAAKQPGRKHNHKPSSRVCERRRAGAARATQIIACKAKAWKQQVSAYWRGERDDYPQKASA